jgi:hypothetical protein
MEISPLLKGYFPEGSFVWLTFCYSVSLCVAGRERVEQNKTTEKKRGPPSIYLFYDAVQCASTFLANTIAPWPVPQS